MLYVSPEDFQVIIMEMQHSQNTKTRPSGHWKHTKKILLIAIWAIILLVCIINKDKFTIQNIVELSPSNVVLAVLAIWGLFALKSLSIVIYCGILYAASGLLFPLYISIPVSIVGTAIMTTVPFLLGRRYGIEKATALMEKYPKLKSIHEIRSENDFFFSFLIRIAGRLPSDPVSMYMGATNTNYPAYLFGSLLGMLPGAIAITILGTSITDIRSPLFKIAVAAEILITIISVTVFAFYIKKKIEERKNG